MNPYIRRITCVFLLNTYHFYCGEDMTEVMTRLQIFCDVGECAEVIGILRGTRDVLDLVLGDFSLKNIKSSSPSPKT